MILDAVRKNKRRVLIGPEAHAFDLVQRLLPTAYQCSQCARSSGWQRRSENPSLLRADRAIAFA